MKALVIASLCLSLDMRAAAVPARFVPSAQNSSSAQDPARVLTADDLAKLRRRVMASSATQPLPAPIAEVLGLGSIVVKGVGTPGVDGPDFINMSTATDDIILVTNYDVPRVFLTDSTRMLRAAGLRDETGLHRIPNEAARERYLAAVKLWHEFAQRLQ